MSIEIKPYSQAHISAVKDFNVRQKANGVSFQFPKEHIPYWLPKIDNRKIYQEYFLALENNTTVRGGYILKHQEFSFMGSISTIACYRLPLIEKIEGRTNNMVVTPEGKISSGLVFYYISRSLIEKNAGIKKFKVIQNSLDSITFQIVKGPNFKDNNLLILENKTHDYHSPKIKVNFGV